MAEVSVSRVLRVKDILQKTTLFFREKGIESARLDAELLISAALGWERMKIYLNYDYPMSETELGLCREHVRRRASGEPVAYILGRRDFYKHAFKVSPAVLIPRPETEHIVEDTIAWMRSENALNIIDLGTGSGCIGLSIIAEIPEAKLLAVDISGEALAVAGENAAAVGVQDRVRFLEADAAKISGETVIEFFGQTADVVVANPPYIASDDPMVEANVRRFEPSLALFSGDAGLAHVRQWSSKAVELLRVGGWIMFEIGHEQAQSAKAIFEQTSAFDDIQVVRDLSGRERFIRARRLGR